MHLLSRCIYGFCPFFTMHAYLWIYLSNNIYWVALVNVNVNVYLLFYAFCFFFVSFGDYLMSFAFSLLHFPMNLALKIVNVNPHLLLFLSFVFNLLQFPLNGCFLGCLDFVELSLQFFSIPLGYENNHNLDIDLFLISRYLTINFKYYTINFNILLKPASILYVFAVIIVNLLMFN